MRQNGIPGSAAASSSIRTTVIMSSTSRPIFCEPRLHGKRAESEVGRWITCLRTCEGWVYLAVILDPFTCRVVGRAISNRMKQRIWLGGP